MPITNYINELLNSFINNKSVPNIYNEASFQLELTIFLRVNLYKQYIIEIERNINDLYPNQESPKINFLKRDIDIVIKKNGEDKKYAIELKFGSDKEIPDKMFETCKDIAFLEQLKSNNFSSCFSFFITKCDSYYSLKRTNNGIYKIFRETRSICGDIYLKKEKKEKKITVKGNYNINWQIAQNNSKFHYFIITI